MGGDADPTDRKPERPDKSRLVFHALCVLDETYDLAREGAVPPSPGLRLALAFLYAVGGGDPWLYTEFWRIATKETGAGDGAIGFGRRQHLNSHINAIARTAGMERDVPLMHAISRARRKGR